MKSLLARALLVLTMLTLLIPFSQPVAAAPPTIPPNPDPLPGGSLNPLTIPQFVDPLPIPGVMPKTGSTADLDLYEIAVTQFQQQVLSTGMPVTTVWGYGPAGGAGSYPAATVEATYNKPVRVKWINGLVDAAGNYLSHLLPIDQTLHWANPGAETEMAGEDPTPYTGPIPIVTHLHGAHVGPESDGYPTAWYLPDANNLDGYRTRGTEWDQIPGAADEAGAAVFEYPNDQRATTLWFHDHALGMTRANVYAGPTGFYQIRGGPDDLPSGVLPSGDYEIPLIIQDKSFDSDGSLFYPDNRAFFEGLNQPPEEPYLDIPFAPDSDIAPIWNPEFFGNTVVVNGKTWPYLEVEQKRYRFRILNASDSRFFILEVPIGIKFWVIGADGGFLPKPVKQGQLLVAPAERLDVIVDFSNAKLGQNIVLRNVGPDEPFGGGQPGVDFAASNPDTTGKVMQLRVVKRVGQDTTTAPDKLVLPAITPISGAPATRYLSLNELSSSSVTVLEDENGNLVATGYDPENAFGPQSAKLGTDTQAIGGQEPLGFAEDVTEDPVAGATEIWEVRNYTADAHPIHIHQIQFEVVERLIPIFDDDGVFVEYQTVGPEPWETGFKDTAIMYPGDEGDHPGITRVKVKFDITGLYLWHCHILSHEDNEMMRPIQVLP